MGKCYEACFVMSHGCKYLHENLSNSPNSYSINVPTHYDFLHVFEFSSNCFVPCYADLYSTLFGFVSCLVESGFHRLQVNTLT